MKRRDNSNYWRRSRKSSKNSWEQRSWRNRKNKRRLRGNKKKWKSRLDSRSRLKHNNETGRNRENHSIPLNQMNKKKERAKVKELWELIIILKTFRADLKALRRLTSMDRDFTVIHTLAIMHNKILEWMRIRKTKKNSWHLILTMTLISMMIQQEGTNRSHPIQGS